MHRDEDLIEGLRCDGARKALLAVVFMIVMGAWSAALACGNPLLYAVLFTKYPEARTAYEAELTARKEGLYNVKPFPNVPGLSYHSWSFGRATAALQRAAERLHEESSAGGEPAVVNLLLADEVYLAQLSSDPNMAEAPKPLAALTEPPSIDAYTTVNALIALEEGQLDWQEAVERGLVVPTGRTTIAELERTLGRR